MVVVVHGGGGGGGNGSADGDVQVEAAIAEVLDSCIFVKVGRQKWGIVSSHRNRKLHVRGVPVGGGDLDAVKREIVNDYVRDRLDGEKWRTGYKKKEE